MGSKTTFIQAVEEALYKDAQKHLNLYKYLLPYKLIFKYLSFFLPQQLKALFIFQLIDEASIMLKQREDNHLSQSIIFHDYVMPYHSHPVPEYVEPEVFTSDSNPTHELNSIAYNVLQTGIIILHFLVVA